MSKKGLVFPWKWVITILFLCFVFVYLYEILLFDTTRPWFRGTRTFFVCAVGENSNTHQGADTNNMIGCQIGHITSDGNRIVMVNGEDAHQTKCGKLVTRYCDFFDGKNRQWEIKKE
jgi:hypothetical protein